ncbi:MAG: carbohydrate ABC transporter permease [Acetivibrionales bacterium]
MNKGRTLPKRKARPIQETITVAVLSLVSLTYLYPLLWLIINSLKTDTEMFIDPWSVIPSFQFDNYATAWVSGKIGTSFFNSVMVSFTSVGVTIVVASMAAFALKRFKWKLSGFVMGLFLIGVMIPIHSTLIPLFMVFNKIGLLNKHISLVLPYVAFALPTSIFILSGFMATFPKEIEEAAVIDGCSMKGVFWRIIFPLSKSSIATISIFNFVTAWNELMFALIFMTSDSKMMLPVSLTKFKGQYSTSWTIQLAAVVIMVLPSLIAYFFLNDKIIKSLTIGAVKG